MMLRVHFKYLLFGFLLLTFNFSLKADHYLGASISYKSLGGFVYEFTVITYTATDHPQSDKELITIFCGDGKNVVLPRINGSGDGTLVDADILKSIYQGQYTYAKAGNFKAYISEPYRHGSIANIDNGQSTTKKLYVSAIIPVSDDPSVCSNNSVEYQMDPIFYAYEGVEYSTHFGLFDADGDSLSFAISDCKGVNGLTVTNYSLPSTVSVDPLTGILKWTNPSKGTYAFAMTVSEFRKGKNIGICSVDFLVFVSTGYSTAPSFTVDPQFTLNGDGAYEVTINPSDVLKYGSFISLAGVHTITYSTWNNTAASVSSNPVITSSSVTDTIEWTTLAANGRTASYIFMHRFSIIEGGKQLQKDFAVLVYVTGNQVISCSVPDIGEVEKVPPELFDFTVSPTVFTDGVYINVGIPSEKIKVFIYDIQGREIEAYNNFTQQTVFLDLSDLAAAMYIVVLWKDDKMILKKPIIKL